MEETQKAIIELIEPFMDKTLSEGCIVLEKNYSHIKDKIIINEVYHLIYYDKDYFDNQYTQIIEGVYYCFTPNYNGNESNPKVYEINLNDTKERDFKIIGHYDITAVLKYINENQKAKNYSIIILGDDIVIGFDGNNVSIPNKPLHLYTEEENKSLLELLLKLNK